jgi:hypothetical protein
VAVAAWVAVAAAFAAWIWGTWAARVRS